MPQNALKVREYEAYLLSEKIPDKISEVLDMLSLNFYNDTHVLFIKKLLSWLNSNVDMDNPSCSKLATRQRNVQEVLFL